jgi:hypothetical protein
MPGSLLILNLLAIATISEVKQLQTKALLVAA